MKILEDNGYEIARHGVRFEARASCSLMTPGGNRVEFCTGSGYFPLLDAQLSQRSQRSTKV
ncbi:MAG: hypothetical protein CM1200mP27_04930 [Chloroflexota bacterium]|nr:MAG: hypothetical protein CM1200mP27_04930 [Chloroflexota bacterium]